MSNRSRQALATLAGVSLSDATDEPMLWATIVLCATPAQIIEALGVVRGWRDERASQFLQRWAWLLPRLTLHARDFAEPDVRSLCATLRAVADDSSDAEVRRVSLVLAELFALRWRRRSGAAVADASPAVRGAPVIEAELAICRGLAAMDHDVDRAADELLALCRIAPDSVMRVCGPDEALRDAVALHPAQWARCEARWKDFVVHVTADFSAASATPIRLDVKSIA